MGQNVKLEIGKRYVTAGRNVVEIRYEKAIADGKTIFEGVVVATAHGFESLLGHVHKFTHDGQYLQTGERIHDAVKEVTT